MLVEINLEVARNFNFLEQLITLVDLSEGQHSLYVPSVDVEDAIFETLSDYQHKIDLFKELYEKAENNISFKKVISFSENPVEELSYSFDDMYRILRSKAYIILENKFSDLRFILLALRVVNAKSLIDSYEDFWEVESNGGCGQIPKLVDLKCSRPELLKRVMVVHDSDKHFAADNLSVIQVKIVNKCKSQSVDCVTLRKREIENYIPDNLLLKKFISDDDSKKVWTSLTAVQKDFYDFKYGFTKKSANHSAYGGLYENLEDKDIQFIRHGFDSQIADDAFKEENLEYFVNHYKDNRLVLSEFRKVKEFLENIL